jgi:group I intron endonuclease
MKEFIVYMHENKINHKKYIGITCQKPTQRWRGGKGYKIGIFKKAIDKYGWNNFNHIILYEHLTKEDACLKEQELIKQYNTMDINYGYNLCEGGNLTLGYHHTKEAKEKMSLIKKGMYKGKNNPMYGKSGILAPMYGKHLTEEHKRKISEAKKGKPNYHTKTLYKKVDQYDLDGNFIKTWESISSIEKELGIKGTHISKVCRGKGKTTGGYVFKYHQ